MEREEGNRMSVRCDDARWSGQLSVRRARREANDGVVQPGRRAVVGVLRLVE